eukprot:SAG11_NODE_10379_length_836_cov_0.906377_1_plen_247_part_01
MQALVGLLVHCGAERMDGKEWSLPHGAHGRSFMLQWATRATCAGAEMGPIAPVECWLRYTAGGGEAEEAEVLLWLRVHPAAAPCALRCLEQAAQMLQTGAPATAGVAVRSLRGELNCLELRGAQAERALLRALLQPTAAAAAVVTAAVAAAAATSTQGKREDEAALHKAMRETAEGEQLVVLLELRAAGWHVATQPRSAHSACRAELSSAEGRGAQRSLGAALRTARCAAHPAPLRPPELEEREAPI